VTRPNRLGALVERDFRLLFVGRTVSLFGSALAPVALAFAVLDDLEGDGSDLGLVLAASSVPQVIFMLVGGIWADRLPRHLVMVVSDVIAGAAQLAIAVLVLSGAAEVWHLVVLQVVRGAASAFFFPASTGIVPETVSPGRLQQANALLGISRNGTMIGGAAAGGILVAAIGSGWALAFDALTYFAGAAFLLLIRLSPELRLPERNFLRELAEGWHEFRSRTWVWAIVVQFGFLNPAWVGAMFVLGPVIAEEHLGGAAGWGVVLAAQGAGLVLGGVLMLRWRPERPMLAATLAMFLTVAPVLLLALPAPLLVVAAGALVAGIGMDIFGVLWSTALHEHIPPEKLSRVSSYDALGSFVFSPVGMVVAGPVAAAIGTTETLLAAAAVIVVSTLLVLLAEDVRTLRRGKAQPAAESIAIASR
jgi:MFS family permease